MSAVLEGAAHGPPALREALQREENAPLVGHLSSLFLKVRFEAGSAALWMPLDMQLQAPI
jgi:hypothetical protein